MCFNFYKKSLFEKNLIKFFGENIKTHSTIYDLINFSSEKLIKLKKDKNPISSTFILNCKHNKNKIDYIGFLSTIIYFAFIVKSKNNIFLSK